MRSKIIFVVALAALTGWALPARGASAIHVLGSVVEAANPVDEALVLALNLTSYEILQTRTDQKGQFSIASLPAGIYRIIAVKHGFAPAIATIVPNRTKHSLLLKLKPESMLSDQEKQEIWAIRRALPSDILRELGLDLQDPEPIDRFSGRMMSMTGLEQRDHGLKYVRTAVGLTSHFNDWTVSLDGQLRTVDQSTFDVSVAEATGVSMTVRSSHDQSYRITTNRGRWLEQAPGMDGSSEVAFEAHRIAWSRPDSQVEVRYTNHDNLFADRTERERIELLGAKQIYDSGRSTVDVEVKLGQFSQTAEESPILSTTGQTAVLRTAEIAADASHRIGDVVRFEYGIGSRYSELGSEWVPRSTAEVRLGRRHSLIVSGLYKVYEDQQEVLRLPAVIFVTNPDTIYPRYRYSIGFVRGESDSSQLSAVASVAEVDSLVRILFDDRFDQFWDGLYLDEGDVHRDLTLQWNGTLAKRLAVHFSSSAGWAEPRSESDQDKVYLTGTLQSLYIPSGTSLDIAYRYIEQPRFEGKMSETERLGLRMGQNLGLPLDVQVLLGVDVARDGSPTPMSADEEETLQTRLVGGLSVVF